MGEGMMTKGEAGAWVYYQPELTPHMVRRRPATLSLADRFPKRDGFVVTRSRSAF